MKKLIIFIFMFLTVTFVIAQNEPSKSKSMAVKQETKSNSRKFSLEMVGKDKIDLKFSGHSVEEAIRTIEKITLIKKGEFESTADFNARKSLALSGRFLGDSTLEDSLAFVTPVTKLVGYDSGFKYAFNADTGDVSLFALPSSSEYSSLNGIGAPDYMTNRRERRGLDKFDLSTKIDSRSAYKGSNAYGATVTVEKTSMSRFGIATNRIPFLNFKRESSYSNPQVSAQFKLENSRAARELPALKVMMVLKLEDPYIVYNFSHVEPKRDNPVDISVQEKFLTGNIIGIVFYSGLTGEVFARLPENLGKIETRPSE
jgi:hypothetical protein